MKKAVICGVLVYFTIITHGQNKTGNKPTIKPPVKSTQKIPAPGVQLKTLEDSANYVMGLSVVNFYRSQGVKAVK
ncbi:MAG TPA: hypothetical protein VFP87_14370, partial [Chitinophagaceae bacterium]|nr:hypothetical protein [Chitinophagaceae bacterium]